MPQLEASIQVQDILAYMRSVDASPTDVVGTVYDFQTNPDRWMQRLAAAISSSPITITGDVVGGGGARFDVTLAPYNAVLDDPSAAAANKVAVEAAVADAVAVGGGDVFIPEGRLWVPTDGLVVVGDNVWLSGTGRGSEIIQEDGAQAVDVVHVGVTDDSSSTVVRNCGVRFLTINGNRQNNTAGHAGGDGRSCLRLFNAENAHVAFCYFKDGTGVGGIEDTTTEGTAESLSQNTLWIGNEAETCEGGGFSWLGSKGSRYLGNSADNCPAVQSANAGAHGFLLGGRVFDSDTDGIPVEATQSLVEGNKASNCGGHGMMLDATARVSILGFNSNANTLATLGLSNSGLDQSTYSGHSKGTGTISGTITGLVGRNDGQQQDACFIKTYDDVRVAALLFGVARFQQTSGALVGQAGVDAKGWQWSGFTDLYVSGVPGPPVRVRRQSFPSLDLVDSAVQTEDAARVHFGRLTLRACGDAASPNNHGLSIEDASRVVSVSGGTLGNRFTTAAAGGR